MSLENWAINKWLERLVGWLATCHSATTEAHGIQIAAWSTPTPPKTSNCRFFASLRMTGLGDFFTRS